MLPSRGLMNLVFGRLRAVAVPDIPAGIYLPKCSSTEAEESDAHAARFILGLLRGHRRLWQRFGSVLSDGPDGDFCQWLCGEGAESHDLSPPAVNKIQEVFRNHPGRRVLDLYLDIPSLQDRFPLALLPSGQPVFCQYLLEQRGISHPFTDEAILWFLHQMVGDPATAVHLTYLIRPDWQERFPNVLSQKVWAHFTRWLVRDQHVGLNASQIRRRKKLLEQGHQLTPSKRIKVLSGVNMLTHFCYPSGLQQAAMDTRAALMRSGLEVSCRDVPTGVGTGLPDRTPWLGLEVYPITITNIAPGPLFEHAYEQGGLWRRDSVYRIAYWAWELDTVPDAWIRLASMVQEIWAPTEFIARAMRTKMPVPVYNMLPGVEVSSIEAVPRSRFAIPDDHYVFLFMFDMASQPQRKNPLAVIRAFRLAFRPDEKATLVIKVSRGDLMPQHFAQLKHAAATNGVIVVDEILSRGAAYGMLALCDCFVSLHRSEGFGLCLAEAMLLGKPVIATAYSGNLDFMHDGNSMLVEYRLVEIAEEGPIYSKGNHWAEPSVDNAAHFMREVFENREAANALGSRAQRELQDKLSLEKAGQRMRTRLKEIGIMPSSC